MELLYVGDLFQEKPVTWGLRGDPFVWKEFEKITMRMKLPPTKEDLEKILLDLFKYVTGENLIEGKNVFIEKFDNGGMSGGIVCADFWIGKVFPLIFQRFETRQIK